MKLLYEQDFYQWLEEIQAQLQARNLSRLDWDNLVAEIEALGKREQRELMHRLEVLLMHLLKRIYIDSAYDNRGWELTIQEQRRQLQLQLQQSPSLKRYWVEVFDDCWHYALTQVRQEYAQVPFPDQWPLSRDPNDLLLKPLGYQAKKD